MGNEIPPSIVRWHDRRRIERFLHKLYKITKEEDPHALATYVNYPTTEYLQLSGPIILLYILVGIETARDTFFKTVRG